MPNLHESAEIFDQARHWKLRVLEASLGTSVGAIVMAMFAKIPKNGPAFGQTCDILTDGRVVTPIRNKHGIWSRPQPIGTTISVRDNLRRLADHCKLSDKDREALFAEFQKWIRRDFRARSEA